MAVDVSQQKECDTIRQTNVAKLTRCLWSRLVKCIWRCVEPEYGFGLVYRSLLIKICAKNCFTFLSPVTLTLTFTQPLNYYSVISVATKMSDGHRLVPRTEHQC